MTTQAPAEIPAGIRDADSDFRPPPPRRRAARLAGNPLVWAALLGLLFGVPIFRSVTRRLGASPAILGTLPAFALTDQRGQPFGTRELAGKVWVADFIFTSCQEACPLLSQKMAEVERRARNLGPDFHLVSISVDPTRDTPARLARVRRPLRREPARLVVPDRPRRRHRGGRRRRFQGGDGQGEGRPPARQRPTTPEGFWQIFHGENLVLVDRQLRIRGYFEATPQGIDR